MGDENIQVKYLKKSPSFLLIGNYLLILISLGILVTLFVSAYTSLSINGFSIFSSTWDPNNNLYGILPFISGTLLTTFLSVLISIPFSLALSLGMGEYFVHSRIAGVFQSFIELIAGIPSIILGFWGAFFIAPILIKSIHYIVNYFPFLKNIPYLGFENPMELSIFTASLILSFMIIPFSSFIGKEAISQTPTTLKEAAYSLGATRYEVIMHVILPMAKPTIMVGFLLSIGRAIGETMAVTLVIGNSNNIPSSLFSSGQTMSSLIANEFNEATSNLHISSITTIALLLFLMSILINTVGRFIIKRLSYEK